MPSPLKANTIHCSQHTTRKPATVELHRSTTTHLTVFLTAQQAHLLPHTKGHRHRHRARTQRLNLIVTADLLKTPKLMETTHLTVTASPSPVCQVVVAVTVGLIGGHMVVTGPIPTATAAGVAADGVVADVRDLTLKAAGAVRPTAST